MFLKKTKMICFKEYSFHLLIFVGMIFLIGIYLRINSVEIFSNKGNILSLVKNISKIYRCPELSSSSQGYFRVQFLPNRFVNDSLICDRNAILLVYILSTSTNIQRRESIRQTWMNKKRFSQLNEICFIFLVGRSKRNFQFPFYGNIDGESSFYRDIVQLDIDETYENIIYKEVGALKWSHLYASHIPYLFKTDDDLIIDSLLLKDIIQYFLSNRTDHSFYFQKHFILKTFIDHISTIDKLTLFRGSDFGGLQTLRSGKFRIDQLAWNHHQLPPYCSGFGFLYSSFIRDRLYRASLCYDSKYVPLVGDVFLSGFLAGAASVRCSGWEMKAFQTGDNCAEFFQIHPNLLICSTPLHTGKQSYQDFHRSWNSILARHHIN